jgi:hypothetical protein
MNSRLTWLLALIVPAALYAAVPTDPTPVLPAAAAVEPPAAEVARIQAHLAAVERELLARDVSLLSPDRVRARARHIRVLREYREAGVFPHNHDYPGERVPYFVDEHGTLCAMAYLISRSGRDDLVERVARAANNARIPELAGDPELIQWLDHAGLSVEEAARIQPTYGGCCWVEPEVEAAEVSSEYAVASAVASAVGGVSAGMNLVSLRSDGGSRWFGIMGITAGAAGLALGVDGIGDGGATATVAAVNAGIGALSMALGAWNLFRIPGDRAEPHAAMRGVSDGPGVTTNPLVTASRQGGVGLGLRVRF